MYYTLSKFISSKSSMQPLMGQRPFKYVTSKTSLSLEFMLSNNDNKAISLLYENHLSMFQLSEGKKKNFILVLF